jgi:hypothetical protein
VSGEEKKPHMPFAHHVVSELRKLVGPVLAAAVAGAAAGGGLTLYREEGVKQEAVDTASERTMALEHARTELTKLLVKRASWDEVGELLLYDEDKLLSEAAAVTTSSSSAVKLSELRELLSDQAQQIQAQHALPPPAPR